MRARLSILTTLVVCLFFAATGKTPLTKEVAKKQIEQHIEHYLCANFNIDKFVKKNRVDNGLLALKKEGYIDLVSTQAAGPGAFETVVLPKGKTLFLREEKNKLLFKVANVELNITSVKEQPPGKDGNTEWLVEYSEKLTRTRFLELWGVNHCFDGKPYTSRATLTYTPKGWKVHHAHFN